MSIITEICQELLTAHDPPFNVSALEALCAYALYKSTFTLHYITTDLHRLAIGDFLLLFAKFFHPLVFNAPIEGIPLGIL